MTEAGRRLRGMLSGRRAETTAWTESQAGAPPGQPRTLVILSTPRSGTHLLAHELAASGQIGLAEEFFHDQLISDFGERFGADTDDLHAYVDAWHEATAAPTGLAAVVVFPDHVNKLAAAGKLSEPGPAGFAELLAMLPEPQVVLLERQSITDQAVSFNRATQSWVWTRTAGQDAPPHPTYDFESLTAHLLRLITIRQWALDAAAGSDDRLLMRVAYESLVDDPSATVYDVCLALELDAPASSEETQDRPERAADDESQTRAAQLLADLATLTSKLRWSPRNSGDTQAADAVSAEIVTIADRQLAALSESVVSHRASAFRRRPVADPLTDASPLIAVSSALAAHRSTAVRQLKVLTHGLDQWMLEPVYLDAAAHDLAVSFSSNWSELAGADMVHLNSMSLGWGHANFDAKSAMIGRARAAVASLHEAGVPIIWSINEPITPGTSHVALESAVRAEIAAAATVIHVPNEAVLQRAAELFDVPQDRVIMGDLAGSVNAATPGLTLPDGRDPGPLFTVLGGLTSLPYLNRLVDLVDSLSERFGSQTTLLIIGSAEGIGPVANQLRRLQDAGAVVVPCRVDAPLAATMLARSDAVLVPCSDQASFVPIQVLAAQSGTSVIMTSCPAVTTGIDVDWADHSSTLEAIAAALENTPLPAAVTTSAITLADLVAATK